MRHPVTRIPPDLLHAIRLDDSAVLREGFAAPASIPQDAAVRAPQ
jgi:hypothetical protein